MKQCSVMWTRVSGFLATAVLYSLLLLPLAAAQQVTPTISVTVNKSTVFRLAERIKRVSVSQPEVADVVVVAPSQLLINGKAVGTTSLIVFNEKGDVVNYDLIVAPDVAALRGQLRVVLPNEKVEISTSGPSIVLKGEVSNEVVYDKVLKIVLTYLPPKPPAAVAPSTTTNVSLGGIQNRPNITGFGIAGGGQIAFDEESSLDDVDRWADKRKIDGIIDLLTIKEVRQIELDVIVAEVATLKLRDIGFDWFAQTRNTNSASLIGDQAGFPTTLLSPGSSVGGASPLLFGGATSGFARYAAGSLAITSLYRLIQNMRYCTATVLWSLDNVVRLPSYIQTHSDTLILVSGASPSDKQRLWQTLSLSVPLHEFNRILDQVCQSDSQALVVPNTSQGYFQKISLSCGSGSGSGFTDLSSGQHAKETKESKIPGGKQDLEYLKRVSSKIHAHLRSIDRLLQTLDQHVLGINDIGDTSMHSAAMLNLSDGEESDVCQTERVDSV